MGARCQVDFYLMGSPALDSRRLACKLATMAWERGHEVVIVTAGEGPATDLDTLLWEYPRGRFVPHERGSGSNRAAPVTILTAPPEGAADVVINLTPRPVSAPGAYRRLLEIVPHEKGEREASREKYRAYRQLGLDPATHEIN